MREARGSGQAVVTCSASIFGCSLSPLLAPEIKLHQMVGTERIKGAFIYKGSRQPTRLCSFQGVWVRAATLGNKATQRSKGSPALARLGRSHQGTVMIARWRQHPFVDLLSLKSQPVKLTIHLGETHIVGWRIRRVACLLQATQDHAPPLFLVRPRRSSIYLVLSRGIISRGSTPLRF